MPELIQIIKANNQLAEGIQWHVASQSIWWTDILDSRLFQYRPSHDQLITYHMPERVGSFAFTSKENVLIVAFASGIAFYHLLEKTLDWIARPELANTGNRFNDGRVDRFGRFWAGTMVENEQESTALGSLYLIDKQQKCHQVLKGIQISNGLCFASDAPYLYHADSPSRRINRFQYTPTDPTLVNKISFSDTPAGIYPDGSCIDAQNHLWNAQWGGGQVVRYTPDGQLDMVISIPVPQPSCVAIGGPNMDWLMVTTAQQGLDDSALANSPESGNIFIYQLDAIKGLEENSYQC